jgi:hypothetical protein
VAKVKRASRPTADAVTLVRRGDLLDLAGVFAGAGKRVGNLSIHEMRRRAALARAKRLKIRP